MTRSSCLPGNDGFPQFCQCWNWQSPEWTWTPGQAYLPVSGLPLFSRSCRGLGPLAPIPKAWNHCGMVSGNVRTQDPVCIALASQTSNNNWPRKAKPQTNLSQPGCCFRSDELKCPRGQVWEGHPDLQRKGGRRTVTRDTDTTETTQPQTKEQASDSYFPVLGNREMQRWEVSWRTWKVEKGASGPNFPVSMQKWISLMNQYIWNDEVHGKQATIICGIHKIVVMLENVINTLSPPQQRLWKFTQNIVFPHSLKLTELWMVGILLFKLIRCTQRLFSGSTDI